MKIIIVGLGKVGYAIAQQMVGEEHDLILVDESAAVIEHADATLDAMCVEGNGACASVLLRAGVRDADLVIAATADDEVNLVCSLMAKKLGAKHTVARVRNPEYFRDAPILRREIGLDMIINPEYAAALGRAQQQRVGRAQREPDGKDQAEGHQRSARYARNVAQVLDQQVQHLGGDDGAELAQEALNVHGEEADKVAQEDEQREHRKEQVIRQRRAVAGHAVVEVAAHEQRRAAKKPVVHHALEQIPLTSALFILHEAL